MIFDLRDVPVTTPETDRHRRRFTIVTASVLVVVIGVLAVAGFSWFSGRLDRSAARARGEHLLAAIAWPDSWQRQSAPLHGLLVDGGRPWTQTVVTDVPDLSAADATIRATLAAAGWQPAEDCRGDVATAVSCAWKSGAYRLRSEAESPHAATQPCPQDRASCIQVRLTLELARPERT